jgi:hypothetical protein
MQPFKNNNVNHIITKFVLETSKMKIEVAR